MKSISKRSVLAATRFASWSIALGALCLIWSSTSTAQSSTELALTDQPTASGSSLAPNILVAVDNSGSMDFETLFATTEGELYVTGDDPYTTSGGVLNSPASRNTNGFTRYAYLFPNGYGRGGMLYSSDYPVPPTIQMAFARSSVYNKSYFDPSDNYTPWISPGSGTQFSSLDTENEWRNAPYDPTQQAGTLNLTEERQQRGDGAEFYFTDGMDASYVTYYNGRQWIKVGNGARSAANQFLAIQFYPATFFMPQSWSPPADYGWTGNYDKQRSNTSASNYEPTYGFDPAGNSNLRRYKIVRDNFSSQNAYAAAMTNFANWFTYYRKRNLAIRGGITAAFDGIGKVRVGSCTINEAADRASSNQYDRLSMLDLSDSSKRSSFYSSIYGMDFYQALGTPNRPALFYLGRELETNKNIIQSPCQRNYAILFTDGFNSGTVNGVGNIDGNYDNGDTSKSPIPDSYSNTIADIAMRFYKQLDPPDAVDVKNQLALPSGCPEDKSLDCESSLHMTTFGVTLGQQGAIFGNKARYPAANSNPYSSPPPWYKNNNDQTIGGGNLAAGGVQEVDDLWHATINTRGALLNAASPQEIASRFTSALNQILGRGETLTNSTGNGRTLNANSTVYQTRYRTTDWSGDLIAYKAMGGSLTASGRDWSAATGLSGFSDKSADTRTILTSLRSDTAASSGAVTGKAFTAAAVGTGQIESLDADKVSYLRGNRSLEIANGGSFRNRPNDTTTGGVNTVMGDIIHSVPEYVGPPSPIRYVGQWRDDLFPSTPMPENNAPYYAANNSGSFVTRMQSRTPMVYVGANDGMLHGFDATSGRERIAYVPNSVLGTIGVNGSGLQSPQYVHKAFVDGQVTSNDVFYGGSWHTILVGGLRTGGRTIYALDITNPSNFTETNAASLVKWEFKDPQLGKTFGKPAIVRLHNGRWAAIFGNGYNSDSAGARLFIVDIDSGQLIRSIDTGANAASGGQGNGLAAPSILDLDNDNIADYVYAGDYFGNLWKFDLTSNLSSNWSVSKLFSARRSSNGGAIQPITTAPSSIVHPYGVSYGAMIYFGTGQDIVATKTSGQATPNSFYGVWDPNVFTYAAPSGLPARPNGWAVTRSQLLTQTVSGSQSVGGNVFRSLTNNMISFARNGDFGDRGWALDFPAESGEAVLGTPSINERKSRVEFTTTVINAETCTLTSSGFFMALDLASGSAPGDFVFDLNGDGVITGADNLGTGTAKIVAAGMSVKEGSTGTLARFINRQNNTVVLSGASSTASQINVAISDALFKGRRTWREIRE